MSAYGPAAAAALVLRLARKGAQVIVKVPDSAGSAGNVRFDPLQLTNHTADSLQSRLVDRLHATGWTDTYPILVGVWDSDVESSPSVQLLIPQAKDGPPVVQGVFEQTVLGEGAAFVGAVPCRLQDGVQDRLAGQAIKIAGVLQALGYYGKCSLDAVVCKGGQIHWIECNGRWSGVSIPLQVLRDIVPASDSGGIVILQQLLRGPQITTAAAVHALDPLLFRKRGGAIPSEGVLILSPPLSTQGIVANLLVFAPTQSAAHQISQDALGRLVAASAD
jgi:hypothetical protein